MNGLPSLANNLASQGRYGDSMLMHVSPGEVQGLQALANSQGTSLTVNPGTGLPEAFKLKQLLPMIAGLALGPAGFALMSAPMAGLAVGGVEALRTGDLSRGLTAGLGAYGGAGLGAGLSAAGASSAAPSLTTAGGTIDPTALTNLMSGTSTAAAPATFMGNLSQAGTGLSNLFNPATSGDAASAFIGQAADKAAGTAATGMGGGVGALKTAGALASPLMQAEPMALPTPEDPYAKYEGPYTPTERQVRYPTLEERMSSREFNYFSPSNPVPFAYGGSVPQLEDGGFVLTKKAVDGLGKGDNKRGQMTASRGLGALPIKGKGHGTSDSIKTTIDGKVPARVSNGEAYVPRKQVQKAGGANKLYALMRKAERRA